MIAALLALALVVPEAAPHPVIVVPPEFDGRQPGLWWVAEALAEQLPRALAGHGVPVLLRTDRLRAEELLAVPTGRMSRASSIRLAEAAGAARIVVGEVRSEGEQLTLELRLLDVERAVLGEPLVLAGSLERLPVLIDELARGIVADLPSLRGPPPSPTRAPVAALKALAEGLVAGDVSTRLRLLEQAVALAPELPAARLALARQLLRSRSHREALNQLSRVPQEAPAGREARFLAGVALLEVGRLREAQSVYAQLVTDHAGPAVLNNYAMTLFRSAAPTSHVTTLLRRGLEASPGASDLALNLAQVLLAEGQAEEAAFWVRGVLQLQPRDAEARRALGQAEAGQTAPRVPGRILPSERILELDGDHERLVAAHRARGEVLLADGELERAAQVLTRAAYLDPYDGRVHLLLGRAHQARGESELAINELRMSLWCHDDTGARMELAAVLAASGRLDEAREEARQVLDQEPGHEGARRFLEVAQP